MDIKNRLEIRNDFLNALSNDLSKIEGGFNFDIASATGISIEELYETLEYWKKQTFIDTATVDEFVDKHAMLFGVQRRLASKAKGKVTIKGDPGVLIKENTVVISRKGLKYRTLQQLYLDGKGDGVIEVECFDTGEIGNCQAGEIISFEIDKTELISVVNNEAIAGGYEKEPNDLLIARAKEKVMLPAHSGNIADYIHWAKEVEGVGSVHVIPVWNGAGTVKVLISDYNQENASSELISRVKSRLAAADGAPIGADVTVESFKQFSVAVKGSLLLLNGYALEEVKKIIEAEIRVALSQRKVIYLKNNKHVISLNKIEKLVLDVPGVIDCKLTLNDSRDNVEFGQEYSPKLSEVNLNADYN